MMCEEIRETIAEEYLRRVVVDVQDVEQVLQLRTLTEARHGPLSHHQWKRERAEAASQKDICIGTAQTT